MKTIINKLCWLLGLPFIGVALVFYKIHTIIDPWSNWEMGQFELWAYDFDCDDCDEDCCD